jgi:parallel beta-helix repeat protein
MRYFRFPLMIPFSLVLFLIFIGSFSGCIEEEKANNSFDRQHFNPNDIFVSQDGNGDFTSIQDAIDASKDNDTIRIIEGVYKENLLVNKSVYLIGINPEKTIIDGNTQANVIDITAENVIISNVTVQHSGLDYGHPEFNAGFNITSNNNEITNCIIQNNSVGIYIENQGENLISYNHIINNRYGMYTTSTKNNVISNNTIHSSGIYGIYLNTLTEHTILQNNTFLHNNGGVRVKSNENIFVRNVFKNNKGGLYFCCGALENMVYHNTFINNSNYHGKGNFLDNSWFKWLPVGGNYWDDYEGIDENGDGIGDSIYIIHERDSLGYNQTIEDRYPLMNPIVMS